MINLNQLVSSRLGATLFRFSQKAATGIVSVGRALSISLGHDVFWPQRNLSVSLEQGGLTVIHGSRYLSRIRIKGARRYAFEPDKYPPPEAFVSSLKLAAADLHASLKGITLVVPRDWVIARPVALPAAVAENLQQAVSFELDRFTPLSLEDAMYDFVPISRDDETINLLLTVCRADVVDPYIAALREESIQVGRIAAGPTAAGAAGCYIANSDSLAFAEVREDGYDGGVVVDGRVRVLFADVFNGEGSDDKAARIRDELSRAARSEENGTAITEAVMVRGESISSVTMKRSLANLTILNDLERRRLRLKDRMPDLTMAETGSLVEALWPRISGVNLLAKGERKKQRTPMTLTVLLVLAIAAMLVVYAIAPLSIERRRLEEMDRQIALMKKPVRQVEALKKEIEAQEKENKAVEDFKGGRIPAIDIVREVTRILPRNAWLTRVRVTETNVDLEGYAGAAAELLAKLEASPYLKKVEFSSPTFRDTRLNSDRFVIKMEIENPSRSQAGRSKNEVEQ